MPTQPLSVELQQEALQAYERHGGQAVFGSKKAAAEELGLNVNTFKSRLRLAEASGLHLSEGIRGAISRADLKVSEGKRGWKVIVDPETGSRESTYWVAGEVSPEELMESLNDAFCNIPQATIPEPPTNALEDYCTLYPLMDAHFGMHAWAKETGDADYDIGIARDDIRHAFGKLSVLTPASQKAILLIGGDFFHADDNRAETPQSKHNLDVDGRHWKVLSEGVAIIAAVIDGLAAKHPEVHVRVLRGNHDEHAHLVLTFALAERYRESERVEIEKNPRDLFMMQWGKCLISAHHGDKAKPDRLTMYLSDVCPFWSTTRHRHMFTGHIHSDNSKDLGPLRWESLRAFCPSDSYAAGMGYASRRAMQSVTFHKQDGIVLRALDPIERQP